MDHQLHENPFRALLTGLLGALLLAPSAAAFVGDGQGDRHARDDRRPGAISRKP